ncbi:MAG: hypothetical protein HY821_23440 [Acidobacteria bacterium]|nr:hypothetical protein [Acidobacteriota bacterium]
MRLIISLLAAASVCFAQKPAAKPELHGQGADQKVAIDAVAYLTRDEIKAVLGQDPGESIVVVKVTVTPAEGWKLNLIRDDFLLRSDRDGQKSRPLEPTQIAGTSVMVVGSQGGTQGTGMSEERRVPWGVPGVPGGSPTGAPGAGLPMPGQTPNVGSATADTSGASARIEQREAKSNPLLDALKAKVLPEDEFEKPVSGLLYFQMEGKLRPKDIELVYRKAPPRVSLRFVDPKKKK